MRHIKTFGIVSALVVCFACALYTMSQLNPLPHERADTSPLDSTDPNVASVEAGLLYSKQNVPDGQALSADPVDTQLSNSIENIPDSVAAVGYTKDIPGCVASTSMRKQISITPANFPTLTSVEKYACIKSIIERAHRGQVITFAAGTYEMQPDASMYPNMLASEVAIRIPTGVTVTGAGTGKTVFVLTNPQYPELFAVTPAPSSTPFKTVHIVNDIAKGATSFVLDADIGPVAYLELSEPNSRAYVDSIPPGDLVSRFGDFGKIPTIRKFYGKFTRQSILRDGTAAYVLTTIPPASSGMLMQSNTIPHAFSAGITARVINPVTDVTLQNFTIKSNFPGYLNSRVRDSDFSNVSNQSLVTANSYAAILVNFANETVVVQNISMVYPWSRGLEIKRSVGTKIRNVKITGAHNKGPEGNGYGVTITGSTNIDATGLVIYNTRHAVLFNADESEHFNYISVTETNRDINFHGLLDSGNVVSVGTMRQEYSPTANATWAAVHYDVASNHVPTVRANNRVFFTYASATSFSFNGDPLRQNDLLYAAPGGGEILGQLGNDTIIGGEGPDLLNGGVGQDTIRGGGGRDEVTGSTDGDRLYGDAGNDIVSAGEGDDVADGGEGDDRIIGGLGKDQLTGGLGKDVFTYGYLAESVVDTADIITDFSTTDDVLDLSRAGYTAASLEFTYDGAYTKIFTKNHKNAFELWLRGKFDLRDIQFVAPPVTASELP